MSVTPPSLSRRLAVRDGLTLLAVTVGCGWWYVHELAAWPGVSLNLLTGTDMQAFLARGAELLQGIWPTPEPFFQAPLYSFVVAGLLAVGHSLLGVLALQALLFGASAVLVMRSAARLWGRAAGWVAGLGLLLYGGAFHYVAVAHSTLTELLGTALLLYLLVGWQQSLQPGPGAGPFGARVQLAWAALAGVAYGLLCLGRPNFLALAPVLAGGFLLTATDARQRRQVLAQGAIGAGLCLALWLPVLGHNNRHADRLVWLNTNGGITFHNSNAEGAAVFNYRDLPTAPLMPVASARFWRHQAQKAVGLWWSAEYPQNDNLYLAREHSWVLACCRVPYGLIAAVFLVSLVLRRDRLRDCWPAVAMFGVFYLTLVFFNIVGRYRVPAVAPLLVVGAGGLVQLWAWRRTAPRRAWTALAVMLGLTLATLPWATVYRADDYRNLTLCAMLRQQPGAALAYLERWEALTPGRSDRIARAAALTQLGRHAEAAEFLARLTAAEPAKPEWPAALAGAQERLGQAAAAAATRAGFQERFPGLAPTDLVAQRLAMYAREQAAHDPRRRLH